MPPALSESRLGNNRNPFFAVSCPTFSDASKSPIKNVRIKPGSGLTQRSKCGTIGCVRPAHVVPGKKAAKRRGQTVIPADTGVSRSLQFFELRGQCDEQTDSSCTVIEFDPLRHQPTRRNQSRHCGCGDGRSIPRCSAQRYSACIRFPGMMADWSGTGSGISLPVGGRIVRKACPGVQTWP